MTKGNDFMPSLHQIGYNSRNSLLQGNSRGVMSLQGVNEHQGQETPRLFSINKDTDSKQDIDTFTNEQK